MWLLNRLISSNRHPTDSTTSNRHGSTHKPNTKPGKRKPEGEPAATAATANGATGPRHGRAGGLVGGWAGGWWRPATRDQTEGHHKNRRGWLRFRPAVWRALLEGMSPVLDSLAALEVGVAGLPGLNFCMVVTSRLLPCVLQVPSCGVQAEQGNKHGSAAAAVVSPATHSSIYTLCLSPQLF